jgi:hypothetical protein
MEKAKKTSKSQNKTTSAKKHTAKKKSGKKRDFPTVRKNIAILVGISAEAIVKEVIAAAKTGQLAPAKYLFEAVGLYPPTEQGLEPGDESLAFTLLRSMGISTEPARSEEEMPSGASTKPGDGEPEPKPEGPRSEEAKGEEAKSEEPNGEEAKSGHLGEEAETRTAFPFDAVK